MRVGVGDEAPSLLRAPPSGLCPPPAHHGLLGQVAGAHQRSATSVGPAASKAANRSAMPRNSWERMTPSCPSPHEGAVADRLAHPGHVRARIHGLELVATASKVSAMLVRCPRRDRIDVEAVDNLLMALQASRNASIDARTCRQPASLWASCLRMLTFCLFAVAPSRRRRLSRQALARRKPDYGSGMRFCGKKPSFGMSLSHSTAVTSAVGTRTSSACRPRRRRSSPHPRLHLMHPGRQGAEATGARPPRQLTGAAADTSRRAHRSGSVQPLADGLPRTPLGAPRVQPARRSPRWSSPGQRGPRCGLVPMTTLSDRPDVRSSRSTEAAA